LGIDGWRGRVGVVEGKQGWTSEKMVDAFEKAGEESSLATEYKYSESSCRVILKKRPTRLID
jgi:hypothetical protein